MGQSTVHPGEAYTSRDVRPIRLEALEAGAVAEAIVEGGVATLAAAGCAARRGSSWRAEVGGADQTPFDLASLTKPMTAVAVARSGLDRRAPLAALLPELGDTASREVSLELLLAHRAGLEAHIPIFLPLTRGERVERATALREVSNARRADAVGAIPEAGFAPIYSDLGYALAGEALARHRGARDAGEVIGQLVAAPLRLEGQLGTARDLEARGHDLVRDAAPTELVSWRGGVVRGRVHDENAWALTGDGGSGHAGMFGTVSAVLAFGCAVLDAIDPAPGVSATPGLGPSPLSWLVTPRPGGTLRAGFDGKSLEGSSAGALASPRAFGHLGFTGTSLWVDPDAHLVVVLLTNRVHPTRHHLAIRTARPRAHDALFARARELAAR
jgi:CubicO group peptidase (beta-lactamase class C family)